MPDSRLTRGERGGRARERRKGIMQGGGGGGWGSESEGEAASRTVGIEFPRVENPRPTRPGKGAGVIQ